MTLSLEDSVAVSESVVFRELEDEAVLLNLDTGTYFGLDPIGTRIWKLLQSQTPLRQVFDIVLQEYNVASEVLKQDLLDLVTELCGKGLLVPAHTNRGSHAG